TRTLKAIQKDYTARNVQVVECVFDPNASTNYSMFLKALEPNFATGYTDDEAVKKYLQWNDGRDGSLMVPYMIFIDARGIIRGDFSGKDGFFRDGDKSIRAELDKMTKPAAKKQISALNPDLRIACTASYAWARTFSPLSRYHKSGVSFLLWCSKCAGEV